MKKFVAGIIIGSVLSFTISAHADELASLVGKEIQGEFPVTLNGEQLSNQAAVVDGTSYLPVRAIGEALNLEVSFNAEAGIALTNKEEVVTPVVNEEQTTYTESKIDYEIKQLEINIQSYTGFIEHNPNDPRTTQFKLDLEKFKQELEFWKAEKAKLQ